MIVLFILVVSVTVVNAASVSKFCTIDIGDISAQTGAVGLATQATFKVETYSTSNAPINAGVYACWSGWPYTLEQDNVVQIGKTWSGTETQSNDSNFYVKLWSMNNNNSYGWGRITAPN